MWINMRLTDEIFFKECINYDIKELKDVKTAAERKDFSLAKKLFCIFARKSFEPDKFFKSLVYKKKDKKTLISLAEDAVAHKVVSCRIPHDFKGEKVDWFFNATANGYKEWPWQLSRHNELLNLARAYRETEDLRYVEACSELFLSWIDQAVAPEACSGYDTVCWRTIECGIRQGLVWPEIIHSFYDVFSDDVLFLWCKSVWEHGERLYRDHTVKSNWLIMELNGLVHISVLYPWIKQSDMWLEFSLKSFEENLDIQVYPDGMQYELATGYQWVVINNYLQPIRLLKAYDRDFNAKMLETLKKMVTVHIYLQLPNGIMPSINDGSKEACENIMNWVKDVFPDEKLFKFGRKAIDKEPDKTSHVFEYAGLAALRTGWSKDDTYVFFDGGEFGSNHQHEDKLSILMYADGKQFLCEGNNYAYDESDMRKYVLSTASHNTALVDSLGQNRKKDFKVDNIDINKKSDLKFNLSDKIDALCAVYDEGYGPNAEKLAKHTRNIYFVKQMEDLRPFLIVADRFEATDEHNYEIMWHLDTADLKMSGVNAKADNVSIACSCKKAGFDISYGKTYPYMQGWTADITVQDTQRPVYNLSYLIFGKDVRNITILYPDGGKKLDIKEVVASSDISESKIEIILNDGRIITFNEKDWI